MNKKKLLIAAAAVAAIILIGIPVYKRETKLLYFTPYRNTASSFSEDYFAGKKVLLVVPHEDDEYNIGSGIMEKYVDCASQVKIVFVTNGDMYGGAHVRFAESTACAKVVGIPEEDLIFLGYGDSWNSEEYGHIYNAPGDVVVTSAFGATKTYAGDEHPDYRTATTGKSADYTRNNIKQDIRQIIEDYRPDVIYAIDLDEHWDHRAVSLLFEEVMGDILKEDEGGYKPGIFKAFGYCTAWDAAPDFYAMNVGATVNPGSGDVMEKNPDYLWSQRTRLPVAERYLARTKRSSAAYSAIEAFDTQFGMRNFRKIVNSDKVFWERRCDGISYKAGVSVSSGEGEVLNDFKLLDLDDVIEETTFGKKGIWIPGEDDGESSATYTFEEPSDIYSVVLYDNPSADDNIKDGILIFDDGSRISTGPLPANGSRCEIVVNKKGVKSLTFTISEKEGKLAGLSEMEVYKDRHSTYEEENAFIKIMADDNFVYDYLAESDDMLDLQIYSYPADLVGDISDIEILVDKEVPEGVIRQDGHILIPYDGGEHEIEARLGETGIYDTIFVRSQTFIDRLEIPLVQKIEEIRDRKREEVIE